MLPLTEAEELDRIHNTKVAEAEETPGGSSSEPVNPQETSVIIRCDKPIYCIFVRLSVCFPFPGFSFHPNDSDRDISFAKPTTEGL